MWTRNSVLTLTVAVFGAFVLGPVIHMVINGVNATNLAELLTGIIVVLFGLWLYRRDERESREYLRKVSDKFDAATKELEQELSQIKKGSL